MFEALCRHPAVGQFFMTYPKTQWMRCLEAVVLLGVSCAYSRFSVSATIDQLELEARRCLSRPFPRPADSPAVADAAQTLPTGTAAYQRTGSAPHQRARHRPLIMYPNLCTRELENRLRTVRLEEDTPRFHLNDTPKSTRQTSPKYSPKPTFRSPPSARGITPRKLPKYLENVESKIKPQVKRDILDFHSQFETKKRLNLRKSSSFGDLTQWSESLVGREEKENDVLIEPNVATCAVKRSEMRHDMVLCEPNTSLQYADRLKPVCDSFHQSPSMRGTAKFTVSDEPSILHLTDQFLSSPLLQFSHNSYRISDLVSTEPIDSHTSRLNESERTASVNSRYQSLAKEYETRRNDFVRRLSSISSISSVVPEEDQQRKSPTPSQTDKQTLKATPSSRASSFPWMDSYSPNTSFYDREDVRNPMCRDSLVARFL